VPALLHVCRQSRTLAQQIYTDVEQGGLFDARDKLLVFANGISTFFWCKRHHESVIGTPEPNNPAMLEWSHVQHVLYYVPRNLDGLRCGRELQGMFSPRAGGRFVETITVITDEIVKEGFWTSLNQGWTELFGRERAEASHEPVLKRMHDAATLQKVKQLADRVPRASHTNPTGGWYYLAGKETRVRDLQVMSETPLGG
jgi:hypothetical protein